MNTNRIQLLTIAFLLTAFAGIASAQATFAVNSTADTSDGACTTSAGGCTLREAVNAANATAKLDNITFNIGAGTPTITLTSQLPTITNPVIISGDTGGAARVVQTNAFGYYRFDAVAAGETYVISVVSKRYEFAAQVVTVAEDVEDLNFTAN